MDDLVLRGMARWPDVPAVYGWLSLDRRGNWRLRGERIANAGIIAAIGRNYGHDGAGCWFFQNGPQRVFVALDYTPFVYRIAGAEGNPLALQTQAGNRVIRVNGGWLDETGTLLLDTDQGIGMLDDRDLGRLFPYLIDASGNPLDENALAGILERLRWQRRAPLWLRVCEANLRIEPIKSGDVPRRFGFIARPEPPAPQ